MDEDEFVPSRVAQKRLGVHANTLRRWANEGKIDYIKTASGQRRYNLDAFLRNNRSGKRVIGYCRVLNKNHKGDLSAQEHLIKEKFPDAEIFKDIGGGKGFKRQGLHRVVKEALKGRPFTLVVTKRDRLFTEAPQYGIFKWVLENADCEILILDEEKKRESEG